MMLFTRSRIECYSLLPRRICNTPSSLRSPVGIGFEDLHPRILFHNHIINLFHIPMIIDMSHRVMQQTAMTNKFDRHIFFHIIVQGIHRQSLSARYVSSNI